MLLDLNEKRAREIAPENRERVIRAIEIAKSSINTKSNIVNNEKPISCSKGMYIEENQCKSCNEFGTSCEECTQEGCTKTTTGLIDNTGKSVTPEELNCIINVNNHNGYCQQCKDNSYSHKGWKCEINTDNCKTNRKSRYKVS